MFPNADDQFQEKEEMRVKVVGGKYKETKGEIAEMREREN